MRCSHTKKSSIPTISTRFFAFIRSRETRGKPSGSTFFAERNDDTGVILRVAGELATEEIGGFFCGEMYAGTEAADGSRGGVLGITEMGRNGDASCGAALSFSRTFSARATMRLAMDSKTSVTFTMALVARSPSRPAMAMSAYVRLAPRERGSCSRKTYAIVYPACASPKNMGPEAFPIGRVSVDKVRMQVRRSNEYVAGDCAWPDDT